MNTEDEVEDQAISINFTDSIDKSCHEFMANNGWNNKNEHSMVCISKNAILYKKMHARMASFYNIQYIIMTLIIILLNGALITSTIINSDTLAVKILTYIVTFMSVFVNFLNFNQYKIEHRYYLQLYSNLASDIQSHISLFRQDRNYAPKYMYRINKKYNYYIDTQPVIFQSILREYNIIDVHQLIVVNGSTEDSYKIDGDFTDLVFETLQRSRMSRTE